MTYIELVLAVSDELLIKDLLISHLLDVGYDSFMEEPDELKAYIEKEAFDLKEVERILKDELFKTVKIIQAEPLPDINWNAEWEAAYENVIINEQCRIRAPFHEPDPSIAFDIVIEPKMSFGTAHHETTSQMLLLLFEIDFENKAVLDMGCGTAVLAIVAKKRGATSVLAIDVDNWAYENAKENVLLNNEPNILVEEGDATSIGNRYFDVVLANINRNILLNDIPSYAAAMNNQALLLMSGFYLDDLEAIKYTAAANGLTYQKHISKNNWVAAVFSKQS